MARFAHAQPDLFAVAQPDLFDRKAEPPAPREPEPPPMDRLRALLAHLSAAPEEPWPNLTTAISEELGAMRLAEQIGPEADAIKAALRQEYWRLHRMDE